MTNKEIMADVCEEAARRKLSFDRGSFSSPFSSLSPLPDPPAPTTTTADTIAKLKAGIGQLQAEAALKFAKTKEIA